MQLYTITVDAEAVTFFMDKNQKKDKEKLVKNNKPTGQEAHKVKYSVSQTVFRELTLNVPLNNEHDGLKIRHNDLE